MLSRRPVSGNGLRMGRNSVMKKNRPVTCLAFTSLVELMIAKF